MSHFSRMPVRFLEQNQELLKSQEVLSGGQAGKGTDWTGFDNGDLSVHPDMAPGVVPSYRTPDGRESGNQTFRRLPNGDLDIEAAKHVVVDIIHKVKDKAYLTELERCILGCMFPMMFPYVDSRLAVDLQRTQLRLAPWEVAMVTDRVSHHLMQEMQYNAGAGGFPTEHRRT